MGRRCFAPRGRNAGRIWNRRWRTRSICRNCRGGPERRWPSRREGEISIESQAKMQQNTREFGVGVVGYGFIGKVHTFAHQALPFFYDPLPARTRLVGVCAATPETGRKAVEQAGFETATTDYRDLLA